MSAAPRCIGVDFGTSNSAAAVAGASASSPAQVLVLDPSQLEPQLLRSVLFFPERGEQILVGAEAIASYIGDEEGRFIQSIKSFLPSANFNKTFIRRRLWSLPELVALILGRMRQHIEAHLGGPIDRVVLGRPAVFSPDPALDAQAEQRLAEAATRAGFPAPTFLIEPIAAALRYEEILQQDELVLVGDFGAGTSDFTLMNLGPSHAGLHARQDDILASTGLTLGGDTFDAAIVEHALLPHFGADSTYLAFTQRTALPAWIVRKLLRWHELGVLREPKLMAFLRQAQATSSAPEHMANLLSLLEENLAYSMFQAVETTKRELSDAATSQLHFHAGDIALDIAVRRDAFEAWMAPLLARINAAVDQVLAACPGRMPDAVFLTGGTSKIPAVAQLFADRFGQDRLRSGDAFTSVAAGLGRAAAMLPV